MDTDVKELFWFASSWAGKRIMKTLAHQHPTGFSILA